MAPENAYAMTEDRGPGSLQAGMLALVDAHGLWGYHPHSSHIGGWPDWVILGPGGALFRELKAERGTLTPAQRAVGARLYRAGLNWGVWRPRDLLSGMIERELATIGVTMPETTETGRWHKLSCKVCPPTSSRGYVKPKPSR